MIYNATINLKSGSGNAVTVIKEAAKALTQTISDKKLECTALFKQVEKKCKKLKASGVTLQALLVELQQPVGC